MLRAFADALRDRLTLDRVLVEVLVLAALAVAFDLATTTLAVLAATFVGLEGLQAAKDVPGVDRHVVTLAIAVAGGAVFAALIATEGPHPAFVVLLAASGWLALDACYERRVGTPSDDGDLSRDEYFLRLGATRAVVDALGDGPKTAETLADETDLTETRVERALAFLREEGAVARRGDAYVLEEAAFGARPFVRGLLSTVLGGAVRRFVRPFRLFARS